MTANIIFIYYVAITTVAFSAYVGYQRGIGKSAIRLICISIVATLSFPLARVFSGPVSKIVIKMMMRRLGDTVSTVTSANPHLELIIKSSVTAVMVPVLTAVIFILLQHLSLIYFNTLYQKAAKGLISKSSKPKEPNKVMGAAIGALSGLLIAVVLFTPISFVSSILVNTPIESLEAIDSQIFSEEDDKDVIVSLSHNGTLKRSSKKSNISLKTLRNGISVFSVLSKEYPLEGFENSAQVEFSNVLAMAGDACASYGATLEANPDDQLSAYLNAIAAIGANTEHSALITDVVKEASRAIGNLDTETVVSLLPDVPHAELIGGVLPGIFAAIADTPDEDIPVTFETFFGAPPVEPARTKELREKAEREDIATEITPSESEDLTEPVETEPAVTEPPETKAPSTSKPTTQKPAVSTSKPSTASPTETTSKPATGTSDTTKKPETTKAPETTKKAETTKKTETTKALETTKAPASTKEPTVGGNTGLIGALLGGGSVSGKTEQLTKNKALFDSIRNAAFTAISSKIDITSEEYAWMYILIQKELSNVLAEVKSNPKMTYTEKVEFFSSSIMENINEVIPEEAYEAFGLDFILKPSSMEVIAIFTLDTFTIEKYPDAKVPLEDIMVFMGIDKKDIPDWVEKHNK